MKIITQILVLILFPIFAFAHPIKMTTGKLNINTQTGSVYLTLNFFMDDFEPEMRKMFPQPPFDYEFPSEMMKNSIEEYILSNFELLVDEKEAVFRLITIEQIEDNVCQVAMKATINLEENFSELSVINSLLFSSFRKQSNILHLIIDDTMTNILQFYPSSANQIVRL